MVDCKNDARLGFAMKRMKGYGFLTLFVVLGVPVSTDAQNAPTATPQVFDVGASLRLRTEIKDDFKFGSAALGNDELYLLTQARVNLTWTPADRASVFIQIQDARIFGEEGINEDATPNIFADDVDLHQGYVTVDLSSGALPVDVTLGRQKFILGAQRLVSPLEWVNTARVWDGVCLDVGRANERTFSAFASRLVPVDPTELLNGHGVTGSRLFDSYFYGAYLTDFGVIQGGRPEAYWLFRHGSQMDDDVQTIGARATTTRGAWDAELDAALQFGTYGDETHRGSMVHGALGYTAAGLNESRFGVAYNLGDGDSGDGKHSTFDNQYPLNHAYYGYMDFFALQNLHNIEGMFNTVLGGGFAVRLAYQGFWLVQEDTDAWYNAGAGVVRSAGLDVASYVGSEIDFTIRNSF